MIEAEVFEAIRDSADAGGCLNDIADQFRRGRDVVDIIDLLDSSNSDLVAIGAWILGELSFALYGSDRFTSRLFNLTEHEDPGVRFHALGALFPALDGVDLRSRALLRRLQSDPNKGVRLAAESAAARLSLKPDQACDP